MQHELVSERKLLELLNARLHTHDACVGCEFTSIVRLGQMDIDGSNWNSANLRCSGQPAIVCAPIAQGIVSEAKKTINVAP